VAEWRVHKRCAAVTIDRPPCKRMGPAAGLAIIVVLLAARGVAQQSAEPLPSSSLPLRLVGVARDTSQPSRSAAFIQCGTAEDKRPAWLFAIGTRACDVAEVMEVRDDAVVVRNLATGRLELLALPPKAGRAPSSPLPVSTDAPSGPPRDSLPAPLVLPVTSDVITIELRKEVLRQYLSNLPEVLTSALATPRYATNASGPATVEGYEMSRIKPGGIVEQLGVRDGDVLLEFNGQKLDSLAAVTGLLGQAQSLDGAKMTVRRNGSKVTFVFSVR
jgi:type II secretory pathway component PulC